MEVGCKSSSMLSCHILTVYRFVEIKWITIRNTRAKSKHTVVIKHKTGARESFRNKERRKEVSLACGRCVSLVIGIARAHPSLSLVEVECSETQLCVSRSSKTQELDTVPLRIPSDAGEEKEFVI